MLIFCLDIMSTNTFESLEKSTEGEDISQEGVLENVSSPITACDSSYSTAEETPTSVKDRETVKAEIPIGEHRLQSTYCLWYRRKASGKSQSNYPTELKLIATFSTCEQFWRIYSHLARPESLHSHADLHVFKESIKPMWEDEANRRGGRWKVHLRKGLANRCWENILMAMLGEQFMVGEEITGAEISLRYTEDIISIWNKTADDEGVVNRIRDTFRRVMNLPDSCIIQYQKFW